VRKVGKSSGGNDLYVYKDVEIALEERDGTFDATFDYDIEEDDTVKFSTGFLTNPEDAVQEACQVIDIIDNSDDGNIAFRCIWNVTLSDVLQRDCVCLDSLPKSLADDISKYADDYDARRSPLSNPRRSRVKDTLAAMARRYKSFDEYENQYWEDCGRGIYWIATSNPEFRIGPLQESQMLARQLRVFCSPEVALLNATVARDPSGGLEVYVAELDLSALEPGEDYVPIPGDPEGKEEYGIGASIVRNVSRVRTHRVIPEKKALRVAKYQGGLMPSSKGALMRQWQTANDVDEIAAAERRELKRQKRLAKQQAEVEMLKATVDKVG
jgi:hypothetical protein